MMFLPKIWSSKDDASDVASPTSDPNAGPLDNNKAPAVSSFERDAGEKTDDDEAQKGVEEAETSLKVWSQSHIYLAWGFIWLVYFADSMHSSMGFTLTPYVTSSFSKHGLTATTGVFAQLIGALIKLPLAKVLDIWGRPQGVALTVFFMVVGLVMMAACQNVETYAAAQVFYWVGFNGVGYSLQVFTADTSALKNRAFVFAFINTPFIISTPTSGYAAEGFLNKGPQGWRWAFGAFSIIVPVIVLPIFFLFLHNHRKAKRMGALPPRQRSGRTLLQSVKHYAIQFDLLGILLAAAGMALFLLPFNIYFYQKEGWRSPMIICMLVFGVVILVLFALYEKYLAPVKFIPFELLVDRTVIGACLTVSLSFISFYIWTSFFSSFLQVVTGASIVQTTWVGRIYNIGSCFWGLIVGVLIRVTGRFKWLSFYFGAPLQILGVGLMIYFRQPGRALGYIVMAQVFIAVAGGTLVICQQIAAMAAVAHKHVAVVLALLAMFSSIGGAIGGTVSAAIWNGVFPRKLEEYLPVEAKQNASLIVASLPTQLSYPVGSAIREAIDRAYSDAQRIMMISATCVLVVTMFTVAMWRDLKVKDFENRSHVKKI
ncbi:siderophore iron transporter [Cordyceps fumosorosea ARSEF 2679]|uniref:Siderophore iron transporter n=1 Tax=Cordyceps fumosorosea (strain ARSEF 2679) TaxID=1081104 RepID=A0A167YBM6_CORFA|nr:siderophore iron transporter [Cordyceps fumosorosea ARSEF 2679]OAA66124.1 siderophore iron transporter [Cordyceps fumosorosea ARSEF 2679]